MHEGELWQVFTENGQPVTGKGVADDAFDQDPALLMGNAHVWLWRNGENEVEILLQKRALTKKSRPGYYHISAGGHINVGETAIGAAVRETKEELGIDIDPEQLHLTHVIRMPKKWRDFAHVYTYKLNGRERFSFNDGEVESVEWHNINNFHKMTKDAETHKMIDSGLPYFETLIAAIKRDA